MYYQEREFWWAKAHFVENVENIKLPPKSPLSSRSSTGWKNFINCRGHSSAQTPGGPREDLGPRRARHLTLARGPHRDQPWARSLSCQLWRDSPVQPSPPSLVSMNSGSRNPCPYKLCVGAGMWVDQSQVSAGGSGWSFLGGAGEVCSVCSWGRSSPRAGFGSQPRSLSDYSVCVCGGGGMGWGGAGGAVWGGKIGGGVSYFALPPSGNQMAREELSGSGRRGRRPSINPGGAAGAVRPRPVLWGTSGEVSGGVTHHLEGALAPDAHAVRHCSLRAVSRCLVGSS